MDNSTPVMRHSASRRALRELSNGQSQMDQGSSSTDDVENGYSKTPTGQAFRSHRHKSSSRRVCLSARRPLLKSNGDLVNSRPRSPPTYKLAAESQRLNLSPGNRTGYAETSSSPTDDDQGLRHHLQSQGFLPCYTDYCPQTTPNEPEIDRSRTDSSDNRALYCSPHAFSLDACQTGTAATAINIQGLTSGFLQPLDFCIPYVRSYPNRVGQPKKTALDCAGQGPNVEHLDISTTWNGLRDAEAQELFRIHQAFTTTLERMLARELWQIFRQSLQQALASTTHPLYTSGVVRGISFCRDQLVGEMADALYSSEADMAKAHLGLLHLYLATNDSLVPYGIDESRDTSITVRVYCDRSSAVPSPIVEAAWVPDTIIFKDLQSSPCEGEEFSIIPQYQTNSAFGAARFPRNISYVISCPHYPLTWLTWDDNIAGFRGVIPIYSAMSGGKARSHRGNPWTGFKELCIEVKAILTDDNGSVLRYERIMRARLTLNVTPWFTRDSARRPIDVLTGMSRLQHTELTSANEHFTSMPATHHRSTGKGPLFAPNSEEYLKTGHRSLPGRRRRSVVRCSEDYSKPFLPVTKPAANALECNFLARQHADLAAKYADLAQRHTAAEKHVKLLGLPRDLGTTQMHQSELQAHFTAHLDAHSSMSRPKSQRPLQGSSISSQTSGHDPSLLIPYTRDATQNLTIRAKDATREPVLGRRLEPVTQVLPQVKQDICRPLVEPAPVVKQPQNTNPQFAALPPSARHRFQSQTFDEISQAWDRAQTPQGTPVDRSSASTSPEWSTTEERSPSMSETYSRKRRARSSSSLLLPPSKCEGVGTDLHRKPSTSMPPHEEDGSAVSQGVKTAQNVRFDFGNDTEAEKLENALRPNHMAATSPLDLLPRDSFGNPSRTVSLVGLASTSDISRVTSSELNFIVEEDPQTRKASRREQAMLWNVHSPSKDSDKENQPDVAAEDERMTTEEKQAMEAAIERSIDDLVGRLDAVFSADPSSGSCSEDEEVEDLANYGY